MRGASAYLSIPWLMVELNSKVVIPAALASLNFLRNPCLTPSSFSLVMDVYGESCIPVVSVKYKCGR